MRIELTQDTSVLLTKGNRYTATKDVGGMVRIVVHTEHTIPAELYREIEFHALDGTLLEGGQRLRPDLHPGLRSQSRQRQELARLGVSVGVRRVRTIYRSLHPPWLSLGWQASGNRAEEPVDGHVGRTGREGEHLAMSSFVVLVGTVDGEVKVNQVGEQKKKVANFRIATNPGWYSVAAWESLADKVPATGTLIIVQGKLSGRSYDKTVGGETIKMPVVEIVASSIEVISGAAPDDDLIAD